MTELTGSLKKMAVKMNGFRANILPIVDGKKPDGEWKQWMDKSQDIKDLVGFKWDKLLALGVVSGVNDWRCFDLDKVTDPDIIRQIVRKLGLPAEYKWVVRSGSGQGYHVHFRCSMEFPAEQIYRSKSNIYYAKCKDNQFDHLELRWSNCQTLIPPSQHVSGGQYSFLHGEPEDKPAEVAVGKILAVFEEFTVLDKPKEEKKPGKSPAASAEEDDLVFLPSAIEFLAVRLVDYNDWFRCGLALASLGESGRKYFLDLSLKNPNYPNDTELIINKKFDEILKNKSDHVKLSTLFHIAQNYGYKYPEVPKDKKKGRKKKEPKPQQKRSPEFSETFWFEFLNNQGRLQLGIDRANFLYFLQKNGFFKMYTGFDYWFIRVQQNIVRRVTPTLIKDFILEFIKALPADITENFTNIDLYNTLLKGSNIYFGTALLEFLEERKVAFHRDRIDEAYFYFRNCYVKVTKQNYFALPYDSLHSFIWEKQIIDRDFDDVKEHLEMYTMSEFQTFLMNVCNQDLDRYYTLKSAIGYLLHTYKDPSVARAIIFCDEQLSDDANGRSGKSLVGHAISKFRNSVRFDGRNFKQDKSFLFQQIGPDTQVIEFNDVDKKFDFEKLFSIITDAITIEKKGKDEITITFDKSPKILISTNYTIQADGDSADDRKFEIEFSNHYNKRHKPVDEFGHRFFDEWDQAEWNRFDNFMIECVNYFLQKGLKPYSFVNLNVKKIQQGTSKEFAEFMESEIEPNKEYMKKSIYERFLHAYPDYSQLKQNKFTYWLKKYARIMDLKYDEIRGHVEKYFILMDKKYAQKDESASKLDDSRQSSTTLF